MKYRFTYIHKCSGERLEIFNRYWQPGFNNDGLILGVGADNSVECLTEKPGATLTWVRVLCVARDFFPESASDADSLMVSVQPHVCNHMPQHLCAHLKIPNTGRHTIVWTHGNTTYTNRNG